MTPPPTPDQVQALFDHIAPQYDALNTWLSFGLHRAWKQMTVDWASPTLGDSGLDICCGSGDLAYLLARRVGPTGQVMGVDFSSRQLAIARQRSQDHWAIPRAEMTWVSGDALALPVEDDSMDAVTMGYGLRNVADIPASLAEIYRVLKPGARAAILDFHQPSSVAMRQFQQLYLDHWVVPAARQFGMAAEYAYISDSLRRFPTGDRQVELARAAGFNTAIHYTMVGGMMGTLVTQKPER